MDIIEELKKEKEEIIEEIRQLDQINISKRRENEKILIMKKDITKKRIEYGAIALCLSALTTLGCEGLQTTGMVMGFDTLAVGLISVTGFGYASYIKGEEFASNYLEERGETIKSIERKIKRNNELISNNKTIISELSNDLDIKRFQINGLKNFTESIINNNDESNNSEKDYTKTLHL